MVVTNTLKHTDLEELLPVFNEAFSDYDVPVSMTMQALSSHLNSLSFSKDDSVGLFDRRRLVGFLLIGRRGSVAYDAGTGIIPSYRGRGLSHSLIDAAAAHLAARGCTTFVLEVLDTNTKAKNLYQSHGFAVRRSLLCFSAKQDELVGQSDLLLLPHEDGYRVPSCYPSSYQNNDQSVAMGLYTCSDIVDQGMRKGFAWYHQTRGSIAQINIEPQYRDEGLMKKAIISCARTCTTEIVRTLNVDEADTVLINALQAAGFTKFTTQSEMVLILEEQKQ